MHFKRVEPVDPDAVTHRFLSKSQQTRDARWRWICREFLKCHRNPLNVGLHLVTTPLGLFGVLSLIQAFNPLAAVTVGATYAACMFLLIPARPASAAAFVIFGIIGAVQVLSPGWVVASLCLAGGYLGQDLAHLIAGERTLQSTYRDDDHWTRRFIEHALLLLPVLLVISGRSRQSPFRMLVARKAVLSERLTSVSQLDDLAAIRDWTRETNPTLTQSTHYWHSDLPGGAGDAFERLSHDDTLMSMIRRFHGTGYEVRPVVGMNELYITSPPKQSTSDTVFYMGHADGPWAIYPGARLYRCMVAASPNAEVTTHFPMSRTDYHEPESHRLETGDAVAFDFNRELHYITRAPSETQAEPRVNLKLHFVAYPRALPWYGSLLAKLTTNYDIRARRLFLQTIDPKSHWQKLKTKWVLGCTRAFQLVSRFVGWSNLAYVALVAAASAILRDARWFLYATSFIHYVIYIGTYRERTPVAFGRFRRDVVMFKTISLAQLFGLYLLSFSGELGSAFTVIAGYGLAIYATWILGIKRTYFSAELGFEPHQRIERFPYGVVPHPMILGSMVGIGGMLLVPAMRQSFATLIALHLMCYVIILAHEITRSHQERG